MRKKQADFAQDKLDYAAKLKDLDEKDAKELRNFQKRISKAKSLKDIKDLRVPYAYSRPGQPTLSLCDEKQLLTMLRADTRDVIPVPEGSLLWTLIQGRCTPIT